MTTDSRVRDLNSRPVRPTGSFVLYWMISSRRVHDNFALDRAVALAAELSRPLVILEALRCDYPWASERFHRFVIDGMADNQAALDGRPVLYYPYIEPARGAGRGLLTSLADRACAVVTDWYPGFFLPRMTAAAARAVTVRMEAVDSNGLIPVAAHDRAFQNARGYRAFMQRVLRAHVRVVPEPDALVRLPDGTRAPVLPPEIAARWPRATTAQLDGAAGSLDALPIDHRVGPVAMRGGAAEGKRRLRRFVASGLDRYAADRNQPESDATSRLSPYLHFGHLSAHTIFGAVMSHERWTTRKLGARASGAREGWWGVSPSAEAFLDQLVVWRELAFNGAVWTPGFESYDAIPEWARQTLEQHRTDPRPHLYDLPTLEAAATDDEVWNAVHRQLMTDGWFHGYLRMLWGKKILEWSAHPAEALERMAHLMNRYSLDGRDPVGAASFAWVLGRYDRPWPERPVFGTVRCMTSASTRRKLKLTRYLEQYGAAPEKNLF